MFVTWERERGHLLTVIEQYDKFTVYSWTGLGCLCVAAKATDLCSLQDSPSNCQLSVRFLLYFLTGWVKVCGKSQLAGWARRRIVTMPHWNLPKWRGFVSHPRVPLNGSLRLCYNAPLAGKCVTMGYEMKISIAAWWLVYLDILI